MDEKDRWMNLLCSFLDSWDNLVVTIGRIVKISVPEEAVATLLS
jgi:hypothetical protein